MSIHQRSWGSLGLSDAICVSLLKAGFDHAGHLENIEPEYLAEEANVSLEVAQDICNRASQKRDLEPSLASSSLLADGGKHTPTGCQPLDALLSGGLYPGDILEITAPPGAPKERLCAHVVSAYAASGRRVHIMDCQNTLDPTTLLQYATDGRVESASELRNLLSYSSCLTVTELLLSLHQFAGVIAPKREVGLLVINAISFPFQHPHMSVLQRTPILDKIKQAFAQISTTWRLTVVVTSQMSNKMINPDGTPGTFDTGARGIMSSYLPPTYLPVSMSHRVVLCPLGRVNGYMKLLSPPRHPGRSNEPAIEHPYTLVAGGLL